MGYKCNQPSSTINNEVTNENDLDTTNSPSRSRVHPKSIIHLFKWYIKSKLSWQQLAAAQPSSYEISKITNIKADNSSNNISEYEYDASHVGCDTNYRQHNEEQEFSSLSASSLAYKANQRTELIRNNNNNNKIRTTRCTPATTKATCTDTTSSSSNVTCSHYIVRQSICLYAASSVILALCYLTTPVSASDAASHPV